MEIIFFFFNHELPWCEFSEYYFNILYIFFEYFRINKDIVEINYYKDIQIFNKYIVYKLLTRCWCVNKSEKYY